MVRQNSLMFLQGTRAATAPEILARSPADCSTAEPQFAQSSFSVFMERVSRSLSLLVMSCLPFLILFRVRVPCSELFCLFLTNKTNQTNTTNQLIVIWHLNLI